MNELSAILNENPVFAALAPGDLDPLLAAFAVTEHAAGHAFFKEGQGADGAYLILSGEVIVTRRKLGKEEVNRMERGEWFGLVALLDDKRRSATCSAVGSVRTAWLSASAFQLLGEGTALPVAFAVQKAVAAQLCHDFRHMQAVIVAELEEQA